MDFIPQVEALGHATICRPLAHGLQWPVMRRLFVSFFLLWPCMASGAFVDLTSLDWSPDGELLLFAEAGDLYLGRAPDGREPLALTQGPSEVTWARFVSSQFIYSATEEGGVALWQGSLGGGEPEKLYSSQALILQPVPSPDGKSVAFVSDRDGQFDLYLLELATGEVRRLTETPWPVATPDFSPDGSSLLFVGLRGPSWEIFLLELESGDLVQLTSDAYFDWCPRFSPDGEWIAFESNRGGASDIWIMRRDGTELIPFTRDAWRDAFPCWSPDGDHIVYASRREGGWTILSGGTY